mmetsp:Transcript_5501/g.11990  ORF Transcript_5501/g.11990 Transcript_5501/m.11990 type:complete len:155 (+) Transcript_5501:696-1160(+)
MRGATMDLDAMGATNISACIVWLSMVPGPINIPQPPQRWSSWLPSLLPISTPAKLAIPGRGVSRNMRTLEALQKALTSSNRIQDSSQLRNLTKAITSPGCSTLTNAASLKTSPDPGESKDSMDSGLKRVMACETVNGNTYLICKATAEWEICLQ